MSRAIVVMAKVPLAGNVKTRLQPALSPKESSELAACFINDVESKVSKLEIPVFVAFAPTELKPELENILQHRATLIEQGEGDLGMRMANAIRAANERGYRRTAVVGTDSPNMPAEYINRAFELMDSGDDLVLGPTEDGGYYIVALKSDPGVLFDGVEWSTEETFQQTVKNAKKLGLKVGFLGEWYDVDRPQDLARLRRELEEDPGAAPNTAAWLKKN